MVVPNPSSRLTTGPTSYAEPWEPYVRRELEQLGLELLRADGGGLVVQESTTGDAAAGGEAPTRGSWAGGLKTRRAKKASAKPAVLFEGGTPRGLLEWTIARLADDTQLNCFVPAGEPAAVHEIAARMFDAYQTDGGSVHLAGCHLEVTPLVRVTSLDPSASAPGVAHWYFDSDGEPLPDELVRELHLTEIASHCEASTDHRPRPRREDWRPAVEAAQTARKIEGPVAAAIVFAKRAHGQLQATIGEESLAIGFDGWARTLSPPAATCPVTGEPTFHLTALSDGRIAAAEQVVACEATGRRHVRSELQRCALTGLLVEPGELAACPITGDRVLKSDFADCPRCGESVPKTRRTRSGCEGCDAAARVAASDPRLSTILERWPGLAGRRWRLAETRSAWILVANGWLSKRVATIDRESLDLKRHAEAGRLANDWRNLDPPALA